MQPPATTSSAARALLVTLAATSTLAACSVFGPEEGGSRCGGAQYAWARVTPPDTGLGAGADIVVALEQSDPYLIEENAFVHVMHVWTHEQGVNPQPDPRVRVVRDDGRVLLDAAATRVIPNQPTGPLPRPSWIIIERFHDAERREALFAALRDRTVTIELRHPASGMLGSRLRPDSSAARVSPIAYCL